MNYVITVSSLGHASLDKLELKEDLFVSGRLSPFSVSIGM